MIFRTLAKKYGEERAEAIIFEAMSLLGRLPQSQFTFLDRDACPRVSCQNSTVWFSYLCDEESSELGHHVADDDSVLNYTVELYQLDSSEVDTFESDVLETMARAIENHERQIRTTQANKSTLDRFSGDGCATTSRRRLS